MAPLQGHRSCQSSQTPLLPGNHRPGNCSETSGTSADSSVGADLALGSAASPSPTPAPGSVPHPWEPAFACQLPHHTGPGCRVSLFPLSPVVPESSRLTSHPHPHPHRCFPFLSGGGSERPWPLGYFPHSQLLPAGLLPPRVTLLSGQGGSCGTSLPTDLLCLNLSSHYRNGGCTLRSFGGWGIFMLARS